MNSTANVFDSVTRIYLHRSPNAATLPDNLVLMHDGTTVHIADNGIASAFIPNMLGDGVLEITFDNADSAFIYAMTPIDELAAQGTY